MLGAGIQTISSSAFLAVPFLGYGLNEILIFISQVLGALVIISFVVTRLLRLFISAFKKTPTSVGDELNADMSSSFRGNPALKSGEDVIK